MKKTHRVLLTLVLTLTLAACGTQSAATTTLETPSAASTPAPDVVKFADPVLESIVRASMGKSEGDITLAEAQGVTRMDLTNALQRHLSEITPVTNLGGLEAFTNLESLDLSQNAVSDISPLAGLTKLTALSLAGNPFTDISPLADLTDLKLLILSDCQAQDYSALSNLVNLEVLLLDKSTITDLSPLAGLTNLRQLHLNNTSVEDWAPLENIYANLEQKDFIIATTLAELGFSMNYDAHEAYFENELASFTISHDQWGPPSREDNQNIIRMTLYLNDEYNTSIGYYDVHQVYVCQMDKEGQPPVNYLYYIDSNEFTIEGEERASSEQMILAAMKVEDGEDPLFAPVRFFNETIQNTFGMSPEKLFSLPYEPPTLKNLGFVPDETPGVYMYEQHEGVYTNIRIDHNESENKEYDVVFFQPINEEYRVNLFYHTADKKLFVGADDNSQGGASFYYYLDTGEHIDEWCSEPDKTVEEYFIKAYNDPSVTDVYQKTVDLMTQYISNTFGMSIEELYALPVGD